MTSEFAPICIYLVVISPLVSLIPLGVPFPFACNSLTHLEKLSAYECGFDPSSDARSRFDIRFYPVPILFIIPDSEVAFSFPWAVPPNKIDLFGSWSMMAFLLILMIGSLSMNGKGVLRIRSNHGGKGKGGKDIGKRDAYKKSIDLSW